MSIVMYLGFSYGGAFLAQAPVTPPSATLPSPTTSEASDSLFSIIFSGGFLGIAIMLSLIALSLLTCYLIIDQVLTLRRNDILPKGLADSVRQLLAQGRLKEADQLCREKPSPLSFIVASGISEVEFGWNAVEKALEDTTAEQSARMYRKAEYLAVLGNIAPMLGLLGTVSGMILAFRQVAMSQGAAGAGELAEGIYSALVTTVAGLMIAIPAMGAFAIFRNRIDQLIAETAYAAQHALSPIRRRLPGAPPPRPATPGRT
jgi:biopolymer transport protein ExbB